MAENVSMIGYTRVSKADGSQVHHLQHDALVAAGVDPKRIYKDSISGTRDSRPGLDACLASLVPGDTLVIWKLDRALDNRLRWAMPHPHAITSICPRKCNTSVDG